MAKMLRPLAVLLPLLAPLTTAHAQMPMMQAPGGGANALNGQYEGTSWTEQNAGGRYCCTYHPQPGQRPPVLTVMNGQAQMPWRQQLGNDSPFSGTVGPDGTLRMGNGTNGSVAGRVDPSGVASAQIVYGSACSYNVTWQKRR